MPLECAKVTRALRSKDAPRAVLHRDPRPDAAAASIGGERSRPLARARGAAGARVFRARRSAPAQPADDRRGPAAQAEGAAAAVSRGCLPDAVDGVVAG